MTQDKPILDQGEVDENGKWVPGATILDENGRLRTGVGTSSDPAAPSHFKEATVHGSADVRGPLSADELFTKTDVLAVGSDDGLIQRIDPASTSTPVQDAIDAVNTSTEGKGSVVLPFNTVIQEDGPIDLKSEVSIVAPWGVRGTAVDIQNTGVAGISPSGDPDNVYLDGWELRGPGDDASTGHAVNWDAGGNHGNITVGTFWITGWQGKAWNVGTSTLYNCKVEHLEIADVDAGAENALVDWTSGNNNDIEHLAAAPTTTSSGANSDLFRATGGSFRIGTAVGLGATNRVVNAVSSCKSVHVGRINYEPKSRATGTTEVVNSDNGSDPLIVESCEIDIQDAQTLDYAYRHQAGSAGEYAKPVVKNGSFAQSPINFPNPPGGYVEYGGPVSDVSLNHSSPTNEYIWCKADQKWADPIASGSNSVSAGGTNNIGTGISSVSADVSENHVQWEVTGRGGASDVGLTLDKVWYDESASEWKMQFSETEAATSVNFDYEVQR